jgi:hypothetical protein
MRHGQTPPVPHVAAHQGVAAWLKDNPDSSIWQRNNLWMLHNVQAFGGKTVTLIALWNGTPNDGRAAARR